MGTKSQSLMERKNQYVSRGVSTATSIFVEEAKGAQVKDIEGNTYLDFVGGIGVLNSGHCPAPVVDAIKAQLDKYLHTCFMVLPYESYINLAEKLVSLTPGTFAKKAALFNSGAEAVENAVKIARYATKKPGVISFELGFHGRTLLTMSLTSKVKPYKYNFGPFAPEVYKVPSPYCYRCHYKSTYPACGLHCLEQFERFFLTEITPDHVSSLIIEPVQGEGGFIVPPPEFLQGLQAICRKNGIIFIADEVQTGFARTGRMFASEHFGIEPDMITMAKSIAAGMPISAVVGRADLMDALDPGAIGGTYGGNPLACAAALANIDYYEQEQLAPRAEAIADLVMPKLKAMQEKYALIGDVRGLGAMIAIELVRDRETKEPAKQETAQVIKACLEQGLILISAGVYGNVVRMLMPLVITDAELEQAMHILENAIGQVNRSVETCV